MTTPTDAPTPLVSVVIPVFNSVSYLAETLDSMLVQGLSETELEIVVVDDGSDDGSEKMVDDYAQLIPELPSHPSGAIGWSGVPVQRRSLCGTREVLLHPGFR